MKVIYYKMIVLEGKGKRLAKFTATLKMISDKRGFVEEVKIRPVDKADKISTDYAKLLAQKEHGTVKNIKACYSYEPEENTDSQPEN